MKYTLIIDMTMSAINITLVDENDDVSHKNFPFPNTVKTLFPKDIVDNVIAGIQQVQVDLNKNNDSITTIKFAENTLDGLIPFDENNDALMPLTYGHDTQKYIDALKMNGVIGQIERKTGLLIQETTPLITMLWLKNNQPEIFTKAKHYMNIQSYIINQLFGLRITSPAAAMRTGFYDVTRQNWDDQALALMGIKADVLPTLADFETQTFTLTDEMRNRLGIAQYIIFQVN